MILPSKSRRRTFHLTPPPIFLTRRKSFTTKICYWPFQGFQRSSRPTFWNFVLLFLLFGPGPTYLFIFKNNFPLAPLALAIYWADIILILWNGSGTGCGNFEIDFSKYFSEQNVLSRRSTPRRRSKSTPPWKIWKSAGRRAPIQYRLNAAADVGHNGAYVCYNLKWIYY